MHRRCSIAGGGVFHRASPRGTIVRSETVGADGARFGALQTMDGRASAGHRDADATSHRLGRGVRDFPPKRSENRAWAAAPKARGGWAQRQTPCLSSEGIFGATDLLRV